MLLVIFLGVIATIFLLLFRFRRAPAIFYLTGTLLVLAFIWNHYAAKSCEGGCDIRVDLLLVIPVLAFALLLSVIAFMKRS